MQRYVINQFDRDTFVIINQNESREICVCSNYDDKEDDEERARIILKLLNESN